MIYALPALARSMSDVRNAYGSDPVERFFAGRSLRENQFCNRCMHNIV